MLLFYGIYASFILRIVRISERIVFKLMINDVKRLSKS
jgi:hypothetical protein